MNIRTILLSLLFFMSVQTTGFSYTISDVVFPYKAFVWHGARIPTSDLQNVTITKETTYILEFTYQSRKYKATLFPFGAIYLERAPEMPLLITFDIEDYKLDAKFLFLHSYD